MSADLRHLSIARWTGKRCPPVLDNAERMLAYRAIMRAQPCNSFDWEALRSAAKARVVEEAMAAPQTNVTKLRKVVGIRSKP